MKGTLCSVFGLFDNIVSLSSPNQVKKQFIIRSFLLEILPERVAGALSRSKHCGS